MRLIDGDHLKKWILQRWEKAYPNGGVPTIEVLDQIDREISYKMIDIDPQPKWIPVSERLPEFRHVINPDPEEDGEWDESPFVLVCFDDGDIECRQFIREDGRVFVYPEEFRGRKPVAWQSLPDPWKEEE